MQDLANISSIVGLLVSVIGLFLVILPKVSKVKKNQETLSEIINLNNKYLSSGSQYHNCNFYGSSKNEEEISKEYATNLEAK